MNASEYEAIIQKISNPDTLAEGLVELNDKLKNDEDTYNRLVESNNSLRDTNSKLALRITTPIEVNKEPEVKEETYEEFLSRLKEDIKDGN